MGDSVTMRAAATSVTGNYREHNEDAFLIDEESGLYVVADGMGGQAGGERASQITCQTLARAVTASDEPDDDRAAERLLFDAVLEANQQVIDQATADPDLKDMGSTVVVVLARRGKLFVTWLGDSRVYQVRQGQPTLLTTDHSLAQALVDAERIRPEEAETHYLRNVLWRYVGAPELGDAPEVLTVEPHADDRFLLVSDGLTGVVSDADIARTVTDSRDPDACCRQLVDMALAADSKDNVTCLALFI